jgi:prepilin-type N-terminal cleavage/methylation domain-containing protein
MKSQEGMTMVELITAVAITGIIIVFLGTAVYHIITVSEYGNDEFTALHEVQNAAYWFNKDGPEAKAASGGSQLELTLADNSTVTYSLVGTNLRRTAGSLQMTLARNISRAIFSVNGRLVIMNLTSAPAGRSNVSENGTYMAYLRPVEPAE